MRRVAICLGSTLATFLSLSAQGATYHVAETGDDQASGDAGSPWRTIQRAVGSMTSGDTVVVADGTYPEVVVVSISGTAEDARLVIRAANPRGAKVRGFNVTGDFVTIDGFDIDADSAGRGVRVNAADHVRIVDNFIHECPMGGIDVSYGASHAEIVGNVVHHNGQVGIHLVGTAGLIEGNEVSETVQHHPDGEELGSPVMMRMGFECSAMVTSFAATSFTISRTPPIPTTAR